LVTPNVNSSADGAPASFDARRRTLTSHTDARAPSMVEPIPLVVPVAAEAGALAQARPAVARRATAASRLAGGMEVPSVQVERGLGQDTVTHEGAGRMVR